MVFTLESAVSSMDISSGVEQMVWFLDFSSYGSRARSPDGRKVAQSCLNLLQDHYPERLALAFIVNAPWWVSLLFTCLSPFMDAVTKQKIKFVSGDPAALHAQLTQYVDDDNLETRYAIWNQCRPSLSRRRSYGGLRSEDSAFASTFPSANV